MTWTDQQVEALNQHQHAGQFHPYTCGNCSSVLLATPHGWVCPREGCGYTQQDASAALSLIEATKARASGQL